ncbi:CBS domain-containing protein [Nitrincola tapanii]|jgi:signal-transduction protein with cAMP-binding, CBS, and nucleotidyltransferase domain|uniref:CBS domain-containing protein n=1 Tax=Nitrincola tapanii TaxID=1708751 RepID=A0A5A9W8T4_9GAMM|nr:CBS domain-containing protein [Nitrincola tapanii]KAA0876538.1 CBS domain-containing protein [Nitrincola tapanii]
MLVKDVMVRDVVTISPFATLRDALSLMKSKRIKSLVVEKTNDSDAYGLVTYTNIIKTVIAENGDIDLINVYDICIKPVISVGESLAVKHVAGLMAQNRIKRVLVLQDNTLLGIVCMDDLVETIFSTL